MAVKKKEKKQKTVKQSLLKKTKKKLTSAKKGTRRITPKKKTSQKKAPAQKKISLKKKAPAQKKVSLKKKAPAQKKVSVKKKAPAQKKVSVKKKAPAQKKISLKKKVTSRKKMSLKKKAPAQKKISLKKKAPAQKKVSVHKALSQKKTAALKAGAKMVSSKKDSGRVKKNGPYLTQEHLNKFKQQLLQWKKELMEEVDRTVSHMQNESNHYADVNDRATHEEEFGRELKNRDRERKLAKKINDALARIEGHQFGYCEECDAEIGIVRLLARPTATMCVDCKVLAEILERQS